MSIRVEERRKRRKMDRLLPEYVVAAALAQVEADGLEKLTMRSLALALDVQAPVIYRHFADKRALMDAMADAILGRVDLDGLDGPQPLDDLSRLFHRLRRSLLGARDGALVVAGAYAPLVNTVRLASAGLGLLARAGLAPADAVRGLAALHSYTLGEALEQQARPNAFDLTALPASLGIEPASFSAAFFDFDRRFDFGISLMIEGIRIKTAQPPRKGAR